MRCSDVAKLSLVLSFAFGAGCSSSGERPSLTMWHAWGGSELTTLKSLIRAYQAKHPEVEVLALQIPHDRLQDKFTRSSAANGGPDILVGENDWAGKLAQSDLLAPVFDFEGKEGEALFPAIEAKRFPEGVVEALKVGSKVYGWPESVATLVMYYNRKLLPKPPATVAEMLQVAAASKVQDGYGLVFNTGFYYFSGYFLGGGGRIFDRAGKLSLNTPEGQKMLSWLGTLADAPGVLTSNDYGKADSLYKQGKAAMILNGPWALADYQAAMGSDLGVAQLPALEAGKPAAPWVGVKCLMVNANADTLHRKLARDFLLYMADPAQQLTLATGAGHIPAATGVVLPADSPLRVFQAQVGTGTPTSANPRLALIWNPMDRAIQEVTVHKHPATKALAKAQQTVEAQLAAVQANR